jgi:hypothetical protein
MVIRDRLGSTTTPPSSWLIPAAAQGRIPSVTLSIARWAEDSSMVSRMRKRSAKPCQICGHRLRRADRYCSQCGAPVGATTSAPVPPASSHYCEITWAARGFLTNDRSYFYIQDLVTGTELLRSDKTFVARQMARTIAYPAEDAANHALVDELAQQLRAAGWEPLQTQGSGWWSQRFMRTGESS